MRPMTEATLMMRPGTLLDQRAAERLGDQKRALQIRVQHRVPIRLAHAHEQTVARDAGVVDQNVHPAGTRPEFSRRRR